MLEAGNNGSIVEDDDSSSVDNTNFYHHEKIFFSNTLCGRIRKECFYRVKAIRTKICNFWEAFEMHLLFPGEKNLFWVPDITIFNHSFESSFWGNFQQQT